MLRVLGYQKNQYTQEAGKVLLKDLALVNSFRPHTQNLENISRKVMF